MVRNKEKKPYRQELPKGTRYAFRDGTRGGRELVSVDGSFERIGVGILYKTTAMDLNVGDPFKMFDHPACELTPAKFPMIRVIDLCRESIRNASIAIHESDFEEHRFEIVSNHECWTGVEWVSICNRDYFWNLFDAVRLARKQVSSLAA